MWVQNVMRRSPAEPDRETLMSYLGVLGYQPQRITFIVPFSECKSRRSVSRRLFVVSFVAGDKSANTTARGNGHQQL